MHCPNCGAKNTARAKFCVNCGEELPQLKKGRAAAAAPAPAVQQIVIKQKTNWLNAIFGILLLAILFCVGSVFLMDATVTSAATVQEMIADPQLYFDGLGRLTDQFVTGAKVVLANIGGGDDGGNGQGNRNDGNLTQANGCPVFAENTYFICLGGDEGECFDGNLSFIPGIDFSKPEFEDAVIAYTPIYDDAATPGKSFTCTFDDSVMDFDGADGQPFGPAINCPDVPHTLDAYSVDRYVLSYKTDTCQDSFSGIGGNETAVVQDQGGAGDNQQGGTGNNEVLCNEAFYQPPAFQAINWLPADTLNFNVSLPVLFGGEDNPQTNAIDNYPPNSALDNWMLANNLELQDLANSVRLDVSGAQFQYCNVDSEGGEPFDYAGDPNIPYSESYEQGLYLTCAVTTDREITSYELVNVDLYAFGCPLPLAIDQFSIPPKELEAYTPPEQEAEACPDGYRRNLKGKCVSNDPSQEVGGSCNSGDVYVNSEGVCCASGDYWTDGVDDSCNGPSYAP